MKYYLYLTWLILLVSPASFAKTDKNSDNKKVATDIIDRYAKSKYVTADVEKVDEKATLGTKTANKGTIKYSAGKFYLALQADKKTEIFYKGQHLILVDYPDTDFDKNGVRKVTHIQNKAPAFLKSLVNLFSNSKTFFQQFKLISSNRVDQIVTLELKPSLASLKQFKLELDAKSKNVQAIYFTDDVNTRTTVHFFNIDLKTSIPKSTFEFKAQKTDQEATQ